MLVVTLKYLKLMIDYSNCFEPLLNHSEQRFGFALNSSDHLRYQNSFYLFLLFEALIVTIQIKVLYQYLLELLDFTFFFASFSSYEFKEEVASLYR
jgi:protein-arginine kinase